ncbi:pseudouridine synthase [Aliiroseovarius sp.]|uniref:pseudouridine synthase n=1 Tax=Aliiroseovarius sp. TaxID=1872442 RepID=UPI0026322DB0|nr:pseudouridine synthase [Aliiroseovarius sp.]
MTRLIQFNKPFGVLPQFTDRKSPTERPTLSLYIDLPGVYPAGRLDRDSEGLMLLTDDGGLQAKISHPKNKMEKTYWVQVEGDPTGRDLEPLRKGLQLNDGPTRPAQARLIEAPKLWERDPPVRFRKSIPDRWLEIVISEGRNRQVRRMTAAIGLPTLRLVRVGIGPWRLGNLHPGEWQDAPMHRVPPVGVTPKVRPERAPGERPRRPRKPRKGKGPKPD